MDSYSSDIPLKQCTRCLEWKPKTLEFFHFGIGNRDRLRPKCKVCLSEIDRHPKWLPVPEGMKQCHRCEETFPATSEFFGNLHYALDGLEYNCRKCRSEHYKAHRVLKRVPCVEDGKKKCSVCEQWKPLTSEYYHHSRSSNFGFNSTCKVCRALSRNKGRKPKGSIEEIREKKRRYARENRVRNRHSSNIWKRNRRTRKRGIPGNHTPLQIQEQLKRQKYCCYYAACGFAKFEKKNGKYIYQIEHTFPVSRVIGEGIPANSIDYIVLACPDCNMKKHTKFPHEWPEGGRLM